MSKIGKMAYKPVGIGGSLLAGSAASAVVRLIWKQFSDDEAPGPLESDHSLQKVLVAAALQGMVFAVVRALIERGGAKFFEKLTGEWPGN